VLEMRGGPVKRRGYAGIEDARVRRVDSGTAALASQSMLEMGMSAAHVFEVLGLKRSMDAVEAPTVVRPPNSKR
jgi:hypothetical protein